VDEMGPKFGKTRCSELMHFPLSVGDMRKFTHYAYKKRSENTYMHYPNALYEMESAQWDWE
jgi:hypothetical protein